MQQHAGQVTGEAKDAAQEVGGQAREQLSSLGGEARDRAKGTIQDLRGQLEEHADGQAKKAAGGLHDIAGQLRSMADGAQPGAAQDLSRQAGDQLDRFAGRLDEGGTSGLVEDLQRFARQRPGAFLLGAVSAGFVVGRLMRNVDTHAIKPNGDGHGGSATASADPDGPVRFGS